VDDRFTRYGIVGVAIVEGGCFTQFVMSCRVIGLGVETAVIGALVEEMARSRYDTVTATYVATDANFLCKDLYARCGFVEADGGWRKPEDLRMERPPHIRTLDLKISVGAEPA